MSGYYLGRALSSLIYRYRNRVKGQFLKAGRAGVHSQLSSPPSADSSPHHIA